MDFDKKTTVSLKWLDSSTPVLVVDSTGQVIGNCMGLKMESSAEFHGALIITANIICANRPYDQNIRVDLHNVKITE